MPRLSTSLAALLAFAPAPALADTVVMNPDTVQVTGQPGASTITGSAADDVIFGDPAASVGPPVSLRRLVTGVGPGGAPVDPDFDVELAGYGPDVVSPDGEWVLFFSTADNLSFGPVTGHQVYAVHLGTGTLRRISETAVGVVGESSSELASFAPNGLAVAFETRANNLHGGDPAVVKGTSIVVKDLADGTLQTVSLLRSNGSLPPTNAASKGCFEPRFSPAGGMVAFRCSGAPLVDEAGPASGVYIARATKSPDDDQTATLVSTDRNGVSADKLSEGAAFSPRGDLILFSSSANNLLANAPGGDANAGADVFVRPLPADPFEKPRLLGDISLVSASGNGTQPAVALSYSGSFAPDGRSVLFRSEDGGLVGEPAHPWARVYRKTFDLSSELATGPVARVSTKLPAVEGDSDSDFPILSPDGTLLAFNTYATDVGGGAADASQVVVKDNPYGAGTVATVSANAAGQPANGESGGAPYDRARFAFLPDGRGVVFSSFATNLLPAPTSGVANLYLAMLPPGPSGDDLLSGGAGNDRIFGAAGNDRIDGGAGDDLMFGGPGDDTFVVASAGDRVIEYPGEGTDTVESAIDFTLSDVLENLVLTGTAAKGIGNASNNQIAGNGWANRLEGGAGNDVLDGGGGDDLLIGGKGDDLYIVDSTGDVVQEAPGEGADTIRASADFVLSADVEHLVLTGAAAKGAGNALDNTITGNGLANRLAGGGGADVLTGDKGRDRLIGGAGADVFVYLRAGDSRPGKARRDVIADFDGAVDRIDLSRADGNSKRKGRQPFRFIGAKAFTGKPGQLRFSKGILSGDTDGDRQSEFEVKVVRKGAPLKATSLILK